MKEIIKILLAFILIVAFASCSDYTSNAPAPESKGVHPEGWANSSSAEFHGKYLAENNFNVNLCKQCHAADFSGGITGQSCFECHSSKTLIQHPEGWADKTSPNFHGNFLRKNNFDLNMCKLCHTPNYTGGITGKSCFECHTQKAGPEACNTCHGNFNDPNQINPPRAVNGDTTTTYRGVGAHQSHLTESEIRNPVECQNCHIVPKTFGDKTHIDGTPHAEVTFHGLPLTQGDHPVYDSNKLQCSNVYCHGNFTFYKDSSSYSWIYTDSVITGNNFSPVWTKLDDTQAKCGTCHDLPPKGHLPETLDACGNCHIGIVDSKGNIIDKSKHINGKINVFGN